MKKFMKRFAHFTTTALFVYTFLAFTACTEQSPMNYGSDTNEESTMTLAKKGGKSKGKDKGEDIQTPDFPISLSKTYRFNKQEGYYKGGDMEFNTDNKSKFQLADGSLTPPNSIEWGKPVTITMDIDYDQEKNELIYTFGPHGCQFSPQAQIKLDYGALGVDIPKLYYIDENGKYIDQTPEHIDTNKKWLKIRVDHFSRYAVAWAK